VAQRFETPPLFQIIRSNVLCLWHRKRSSGMFMFNTTFKLGDIVRLKSGGPKMTVIGGELSNVLQCAWFMKTNLCEDANFPVAALEAVNDGPDEGLPAEANTRRPRG
jgi:uncharacterized protein YodC (DUF2158 family)